MYCPIPLANEGLHVCGFGREIVAKALMSPFAVYAFNLDNSALRTSYSDAVKP
jgi:hypothetical protein